MIDRPKRKLKRVNYAIDQQDGRTHPTQENTKGWVQHRQVSSMIIVIIIYLICLGNSIQTSTR